jgi:hypothetical protein
LRRKCFLQQVIEGKIKGGIEVKGRRGRRRRKILDDLKETRGYPHLKEEALDHTMWRAVVGQIANGMNERMNRKTNCARCLILGCAPPQK